MGIATEAWLTLKEKGLIWTVQIVLSTLADFLFDLYYGTDTMNRAMLDALDIPGANKARGGMYQATRARPFRRLMKRLQLPGNAVLADVGCGKGRVLLMAANMGFKRLVGIEFSRELCEIARRNIKIYGQKTGLVVDTRVIETDAASWQMEGDENVFFLFNPFDCVVMAQFIGNLEVSLCEKPRDVWMIYNNPICHTIVKDMGRFEIVSTHRLGGSEFTVYVRRMPRR